MSGLPAPASLGVPDEPLTRRPSRLTSALSLVRSVEYIHSHSPVTETPIRPHHHAHFDIPSSDGTNTPQTINHASTVNAEAGPSRHSYISGCSQDEERRERSRKKESRRAEKKKKSLIDIEHVPVDDDPRMWSEAKKNVVLIMIILALFAPQMIPSLFNPVIDDVRKDLGATDTQIGLSISMFILFQGGLPPVWTTIAEIIGRKPIYLITSLLYLIGSIVASQAQSMPVLIGMRAFQAFGTSGAVAVGAGSLADMYDTHERGAKLGWYYGMPLLAPSLGPLIGGSLGHAFGWRASLYFNVVYAGLCFIMFLFMPETWRKERSRIYQQAIEHAIKRALNNAKSEERKRERKLLKGLPSNAPTPPVTPGTETPATWRTNSPDGDISNRSDSRLGLATPVDAPAPAPADSGTSDQRKVIVDTERNEVIVIRRDWRWLGLRGRKVIQKEEEHEEVRPSFRDINPLPIMVSIFRQPPNAIVLLGSGVFFAASYTIVYTASITLAAAPYNYNALMIGVTSLSFGIGNIVGSVAGGQWSDISLKKQRAARGGKMVPEMRLKSPMLFMPFMVASFLSYAWTAGKHVHVAGLVVSLFGSGLFLMLIYTSTLAYVVDANPGRASAAVGANSFCRGMMACIMSQSAIPALNSIGDGGLYTIFAGLLALSSAAMVFVAYTGERWRADGKLSFKSSEKVAATEEVVEEDVSTGESTRVDDEEHVKEKEDEIFKSDESSCRKDGQLEK